MQIKTSHTKHIEHTLLHTHIHIHTHISAIYCSKTPTVLSLNKVVNLSLSVTHMTLAVTSNLKYNISPPATDNMISLRVCERKRVKSKDGQFTEQLKGVRSHVMVCIVDDKALQLDSHAVCAHTHTHTHTHINKTHTFN